MNKTSLVDVVATKTDLKKKDVDLAVSAVVEAIKEALVAGDKIQLIGLGTLEVKERAARNARNPRTGETIEVPASNHVAFSASKTLRDALNK